MPGQVSIHPTRAPFSLKFVVVGGNISGLATAYSLKQAGHSVLVIDKGDGTPKSVGGLRSPPNMTRILNQWGLAPALEKISQKCNTFKLHNGGSGESIGSMIMTESFLVHLLADFLFVKHGDLETLLYEIARDAGVKFLFGNEVVDANSDDVTVTLKNGDVITADVIVGADGYDSVLREIVTGEPELPPSEVVEKKVWITFTLPVEVLQSDDELSPLVDPLFWWLWLGDGYILSANLLAGGKEFAVSLVYNDERPLKEGGEEWREVSSLDEFRIDYSKFASLGLKLLKAGTKFISKVCRVRSHLDSLVCDNARIVLVGEAAHPMLPSGHHTSGLAMEDAQALGTMFSRIQRRDQVAQFLTAYEEIRQPRVSEILDYEIRHQAMLTCPAGPAMEHRDTMMRAALAYGDWEHMDEHTFNAVWGTEVDIQSYDAAESVEDWWTRWGSYFDKSNSHRKSMEVPHMISVRVS